MKARNLVIGMLVITTNFAQAQTTKELGENLRRRIEGTRENISDFWKGFNQQTIGTNRPVAETQQQKDERTKQELEARRRQEEASRSLTISRPTTITIGYGTEKKELMQRAATAFMGKNPNITINLLGIGSVEGMNAVLRGGQYSDDKGRTHQLTVWSPASSLLQKYVTDSAGPEIFANLTSTGKAQAIVKSPMVFIMGELAEQCLSAVAAKKDFPERANLPEAQRAFGKVGFQLFNFIKDQETKSQTNFGTLATQWTNNRACRSLGSLRVSFTDPLKSNSGLMTTIMIGMEAYEKMGKSGQSTVDDNVVRLPEFKELLKSTIVNSDTDEHSTGTLAKNQREKPLQYTVVVSYENLAIESYQAALNQRRKLRIVYPEYNVMNDNPYYILNLRDVISADQQKAAVLFMKYLTSAEVQRAAVGLGFRPVDDTVNMDVNGFGTIGGAAQPSNQPGIPMSVAARSGDLIVSEDEMLTKGLFFIEAPSEVALTELLNAVTAIRKEQGKLLP